MSNTLNSLVSGGSHGIQPYELDPIPASCGSYLGVSGWGGSEGFGFGAVRLYILILSHIS